MDTGRRTRWVAADAGVAIVHRRALGTWYFNSLLAGSLPPAAYELTMPQPRPDAVEQAALVTEYEPRGGQLARAIAWRAAVLAALGVFGALVTPGD